MELSVGMYVRSKINGMIGKITDIEENKVFDRYLTVIREETRYILDDNHNRGFCETENDSVKASHNIIDLIEVGDYVNGNKIVHIQEEEYPYYPKRLIFAGVDINNPDDVWECYNNDDIKSIVTKEMFSSVEYRVETN